MNKRLESLIEGEHWFNKYLGVDKSRSIRKAPRRRRRTNRKPKVVEKSVSETLITLSKEPSCYFELRACQDYATQGLPALERPLITTYSRATIGQLKKLLVVRVADYDYQVGLLDPISDPDSFIALSNSISIGQIKASLGTPRRELVLFYQLEPNDN